MHLYESPGEALRVPVQSTRVTLESEQGEREAVCFLSPGVAVEDLFEQDVRFVPVGIEGAIRMYARTAIVSIIVDVGSASAERSPLDLTYQERAVAVHLRNGKVLRGHLRLPSRLTRTLDLLNQSSRSFAVHDGAKVHHVSKAHVEQIEEL